VKKLILTSIFIIFSFIISLNFIKKDNNLAKNNINEHLNDVPNQNINIYENIINKKKSSAIVAFKTYNIENSPFISSQHSEKKIPYLTYLNYRKEEHQSRNKKIIQHLIHQKNLKHIREGGVEIVLEKEKKKHEIKFQNQYISNFMSTKREQQENFRKQRREFKQKREQIESLKEKQLLQTKYKGAL
jgi:hypothetical protein